MSMEYIESNVITNHIKFISAIVWTAIEPSRFNISRKKNFDTEMIPRKECNTNMLSYETQYFFTSYIGRLTFLYWIHFTYISLCMPDWFRRARCAPPTSHLQFTNQCQTCGWQHNLWFNIPDSPGLIYLWTLSLTPRQTHKLDLLGLHPIQ